jgi:Passenger-associated-transport-repeat
MKKHFIPQGPSFTHLSPCNSFIACLVLVLTPAAWAASETFTTPGTIDWVCPPGVTSLTIECRGGGGAGGSATRSGTAGSALSGGGAGGGYARTVITPTANATYKVVVGGGGVSLTTVATNGTVDPGQRGGDSKFTDAAGTVPEIVLATGGAGGTNARVASNTVITQPGGDGSSAGSIGDVGAIFRGGNGGDAGASGGGGGGGAGDAADAADVLVSITGGTGGSVGGGNGSSGRGSGSSGANASPGAAPGGGGGGVKIQTTNASNLGGAGGAGTVKLTYTFASGLDRFDVVASSPQTAGEAFDVIITAQDSSNFTVDDSTTVVTMSSPAGSLMEFDWNSNGIYGDNSGTLENGVKTIKARNKKAETKTIVASTVGISTATPPSVQTLAAAYAQLQILAPGETTAPGTDPGKTGTPSTQQSGIPFNVTVNAVDAFWNAATTVSNSVGITSSDASATLPANADLFIGTKTFSTSLNTIGGFTLTATDLSDTNSAPGTTATIPVISSAFTWDAGNTTNGGTINPADGTWNNVLTNSAWNDSLANVPWDPTREAIFGGADGTYAITVGENISVRTLSFANSGYTLSATAARTVTIPQSPGPVRLALAAGKTATVGTNVSVIGGFTYFLGATSGSAVGGTLNIEGTGATVRTASSSNSVNLEGSGTVINVKTGGFLGTPSGNGSGNMSVGTGSSSSDVSLNVDGGTVAIQGTIATGAQLNIGGATGQGTVTLNSGNINVSTNSNVGLLFGNGTDKTNTLHLNGGTLAAPAVRKLVGDGTAVFNFNGGILQARRSDTGFMSGLNQANVKSGGAFIDTQAFNVTIDQSLLADTVSGGLTKSGSGTLTLTGTNTYSGPTAVNVGTLALVGGSQSSAITVASLAKLGFTLNSPTTSTAAVNLTAGTVAITGTVDGVASYKLMTATSFTGPFTLSPLVPGYALELQAGGTELWLVPGGDPFSAWAGMNVNFDDDSNNDGVDNGLAWLLGAADKDVNATGLLPVISQTGGDLKMTFDMLPASARGTAQLFLEHSNDLGINDLWSGVLVPDATGGSAPVTFIVSGTSRLDVEVTVSSTESAAGKLFGRLRAVK